MSNLGPIGPFPDSSLRAELERRWLHYAFRSNDGAHSMVANLSTLGASSADAGGDVQRMSILLLHSKESGWSSSQFNAVTDAAPWSSFRHPQRDPGLRIRSVSGAPAVHLTLRRTGHPCTSQCAPFARDQHLRWQCEPGIHAAGDLALPGRRTRVHLVGYHERVRGHWGWPELGGWVFGFSNAETPAGSAPSHSVVFTLIQPPDPPSAPTASVMVWRRGRLLRHFPRRRVDVAVSGQLSRDRVVVCPPLAATLGTAPTSGVPERLVITCAMGDDRLAIDITAESAARIVNPSESGLAPFSVHEVIGPCRVSGTVSDEPVSFSAGAVVEFAGGAVVD